jgi:hypothetical protein
LIVFNFCSNREWLVSEVSQTASQLLSRAIPKNEFYCKNLFKWEANEDLLLVIIDSCSIIGHGHNKRIVVFVVIVERIKENAQPVPLII